MTDPTPAEERTLAWKTLDCRTTTCLQPAGRRCITSSGERTSPHAPRIYDIRAYLLGQATAQAENAALTEQLANVKASNEQYAAALKTADDKLDMAMQRLANLQLDLTHAQQDLADYKASHPDVPPPPPPDPEPTKQRMLIGAGGGNGDRTKQKIDLDRRYYGGSTADVDKFIAAAKANHAADILTWATFKLPVSWGSAATGGADVWFLNLVKLARALGFEVWVDFHHEPEGDGDGNLWRQFQGRFANLLGDGATGPVKFLLCVTGWSEEYETDPAKQWSTYWPTEAADKIYAIAYDNPYLRYGTRLVKESGGAAGTLDTKWTEAKAAWIDKLEARAKSLGVKAAIGEMGYSDEAFAKDPAWLDRTFAACDAAGLVAVCYFDSTLNSTRSWTLGTGAKRARFEQAAAALR